MQRREQADLAHRAADAAGLHEMSHAERAQHQQHHAGCDVGERALERETDGEAGGAENRDQTRRLHTELAEHKDDGENQDHIAKQRRDQRLEGGIERNACEAARRQPLRPGRANPPNDEDQNAGNDAQTFIDQQHIGRG